MKGNVVKGVGGELFGDKPHSHYGSSVARQYFTFVMMVCDDDAIQRLLPQLIIVGDALVSWAEFSAIQAWLPHNFYLKRRCTGWNSAALFIELVSVLKAILEPFKDTIKFIFMFDAVPLHLEASVLASLSVPDLLWFILIPAKTTWLLQPLDVGVFNILKRQLRRRYANSSLTETTGKEVIRMVRLLVEVASELVVHRSSKKVFRKTGFWQTQQMCSRYILKQLEMVDPPVVLPLQPTDAILSVIWPSNRRITFSDIASTQPVSTGVPAAILDAPPHAPAAAEELVELALGGGHALGLDDPMLGDDSLLYEPASPAASSPAAPVVFPGGTHPPSSAVAAPSHPSASSSSAAACPVRRRCSFKQPD